MPVVRVLDHDGSGQRLVIIVGGAERGQDLRRAEYAPLRLHLPDLDTPTIAAPAASFRNKWESASAMTSCPGRALTSRPSRLPMVPLATKSAASLPIRSAA